MEFLCFLRVFAFHSCSVWCVCVDLAEFFTQIPVFSSNSFHSPGLRWALLRFWGIRVNEPA